MKQRVFLSSVFRERIGGSWARVPLRDRILEAREDLPVELWAYELFWPEGEDPQPSADLIVDRCFAGVRNCDLFVFLLTGRHGTGVGYADSPAVASYLELELFAAAMLRKAVLVLRREEAGEESALADTLALLQRSFPRGDYVVASDNVLYERFVLACAALAAGTGPLPTPALTRIPDWLASRRSHRSFDSEMTSPRLRFLDGRLQSSRGLSDPAKAKLLLDQVTSGTRQTQNGPDVLPHGAALFRLWAAMRELMSKSEDHPEPELAQLWDRAFGLWSRSASWFGLHGHLWMGPLASVQSQTDLRRRLASVPAFREATDVREPLGARASALYSIAQRMQSWHGRMRQYRLADALATGAIKQNPTGSDGALLIRGHTAMQMARLGYAWELWRAEKDFRRALDMREKSGATAPGVGEAQVALGGSLVLTGRWRRGLYMMQEGVTGLRAAESPGGLAFLARGLRTLERAARVSLRRDIAEAARQERMELAARIEAMDQAREA